MKIVSWTYDGMMCDENGEYISVEDHERIVADERKSFSDALDQQSRVILKLREKLEKLELEVSGYRVALHNVQC